MKVSHITNVALRRNLNIKNQPILTKPFEAKLLDIKKKTS